MTRIKINGRMSKTEKNVIQFIDKLDKRVKAKEISKSKAISILREKEAGFTKKINNILKNEVIIKKEIEAYLQCSLCLKELPKGKSPQSFQKIEVGRTKKGLQVWCNRHNCNVIHMDFKGNQLKSELQEYFNWKNFKGNQLESELQEYFNWKTETKNKTKEVKKKY